VSKQAAKKAPTALKKRIVAIKSTVKNHFKNVLSKIKKQPKKAKKISKAAAKIKKQQYYEQLNHGIIGLGLLLVIVSITYSTVIVREFVDTTVSLLAIAPQVVFAIAISIKAFSKLYK
jgi:hypothetical protein